jgi:hypothetical protein
METKAATLYIHTHTHTPLIYYSDLDEDVDVMVTVQTAMREVPVSNLCRVIYNDDCRNYHQRPQANSQAVFRIGHHHIFSMK